jgi:hypothetical protein
MVACGRAATAPSQAPASNKASSSTGSFVTPGVNVDVITGAETYPHVTQSEDQIAVNGSTVAVAYNDSISAASGQYSGISVSTDGGATFTRQLPSPFATGHGNNYGDPILVYNKKFSKWVTGDLVGGCGSQGLGLWTSTNATAWSTGVCAHTGNNDDRESMSVDNNSSSPFYGNMYISWNDFDVGSGALEVIRSSDGGATWTAPVVLSASFIRDVQNQVAPDGTLLVAAMNEGGGGSSPRQNFIYRSTDGGLTFFAATSMGAPFAAPGDFTSGYFAIVNPIWRYMGWGDLATGSNNTVIYSYTVHGTGAFGSGDGGDIYTVRSTDDGITWGAPVRVDGDASGNEQWMPSTAGGGTDFLVAWYDRRNTTNGTNYERWGVKSTDGGLTWSSPQRISDVLITQPEQPDPNVQPLYAGDYMRDYFDGTTYYDAWTDGRNQVSGHNQQDVELTTLSPGFVQATTMTLACVPNPQEFGQPVTCTATVSPAISGTPTGNVAFTDNSSTIPGCGAKPLNQGNPDKAVCTFTPGTLGSHTIVATYGGDANYTGSSATFVESVIGGTITVTKHLVSNAIDPAKFNLLIDGSTYAVNIGNGGTTGAVTVATGSHTVSETAGINANMSNYTARIACSDGSAGYGTSLSGVTVDNGDAITCTITNTRKLFKVP